MAEIATNPTQKFHHFSMVINFLRGSRSLVTETRLTLHLTLEISLVRGKSLCNIGNEWRAVTRVMQQLKLEIARDLFFLIFFFFPLLIALGG